MEVTYPNWKNLPVEILHKIFKLVVAKDPQVYKIAFTHTCTTWEQPAREVLYSNITIENSDQLKKFYDTVMHNKSLGRMARVLDLELFIQGENNSEVMTTLLSTYLPNLEILKGYGAKSYIPPMDALLDHQLKRLKRLEAPSVNSEKSEVLTHITCVLLMKKRIECILIADNFYFETRTNSAGLTLNRLYNKLHQFENLKHIVIKRKAVDEIQVLEHVLEACRSLKKITFIFNTPDKEANSLSPNNGRVPMDVISTFIPRVNIKSIICNIDLSTDYKLLLYIMHTFPKLDRLSLGWVEDCLIRLDHHVLTKLLHYLSGITYFSLFDVKVDYDTIAETIGKYWTSTSKPGSEHIKFLYREIDMGEERSTEFSMRKRSINPITTVEYFAMNHEWAHTDFIEKYGNFVKDIRFFFESKDFDVEHRCLPENCIDHVFKYCPNLQGLHFDFCILKRFTFKSGIDLSRRKSLNELSFSYCFMLFGMLDQLSLIVDEIKQLRFGSVIFLENEDELQDDRNEPNELLSEIIMPYTKIDSIILTSFYLHSRIFFKMFVMSHGNHYYYRHTFLGIGHIEDSSEEEYLQANKSQQVYICCQNKPKLQMEISENEEDHSYDDDD